MSKSLFLAWRSGDTTTTKWGPVGRLDRINGLYVFRYTRGAKTLEGFQPLPGMPDLDKVYESEDMLPFFANRLLDSSRPEYRKSLEWSDFDPGNPPDPIAILGVTEGQRATDSFEVFPCPAPDASGDYVTKFFLRGLSHKTEEVLERINHLSKGDNLELKPDDSNPVDPDAVAVLTDDEYEIGYVPRYLALDIRELLKSCDGTFVTVERVNEDAPLQQRVLCLLRSCWPDNFGPCSRNEFQPLVSPTSQTA